LRGSKHFSEVVLEFVSANPLPLPLGPVLTFSTSIKRRLLRDSFSRLCESKKQLVPRMSCSTTALPASWRAYRRHCWRR